MILDLLLVINRSRAQYMLAALCVEAMQDCTVRHSIP